ncbi:MAG: hypothetical protein OH318_02075 [Candidatus Parvarchaeota archaeon]|nr:hypothetical protein [Candidatus Rehaiarchaeum fermentans]
MERVVVAKIRNARVSLKDLREVALSIKNKNVNDAEKYLKKVLEKRDFIPYLHYPHGHKHGIQAGYPTKAIKLMLRLIKQLRANVKNLGGNDSEIKIERFDLGRGEYPLVFNYARFVKSHRGKRTNITIYTTIKVEKTEEKKEQNTAETNKIENKAQTR